MAKDEWLTRQRIKIGVDSLQRAIIDLARAVETEDWTTARNLSRFLHGPAVSLRSDLRWMTDRPIQGVMNRAH